MSRHPFGWSYPAGAENDPSAPWNQVDDFCDVCEKPVDRCKCPECPVCRVHGNPKCYEYHGLSMEPLPDDDEGSFYDPDSPDR